MKYPKMANSNPMEFLRFRTKRISRHNTTSHSSLKHFKGYNWSNNMFTSLIVLFLLSCFSTLPVNSKPISQSSGELSLQNRCKPIIEELANKIIGNINLSDCMKNRNVHQKHSNCQCKLWNITIIGGEFSKFRIVVELPNNLVSHSSKAGSINNDRFSGRIDVFALGNRVYSWNVQDQIGVFEVRAKSLLVLFDSGNNHPITNGDVSESHTLLFPVLSYVVVSEPGEELLCEDDLRHQHIPNGQVLVTDRTLGSRLRVRCDRGFQKSLLDKDPVCHVTESGVLGWEEWAGSCLASCPKPEPIKHGLVSISNFIGGNNYDVDDGNDDNDDNNNDDTVHDDTVNNNNTFDDDNVDKPHTNKIVPTVTSDQKLFPSSSSSIIIISKAKYSCKEPYVLEGEDSSVCVLDKHNNNNNTPLWRPTRSSQRQCVIPSCNNGPITLKGSSGAIVNPSYPDFMTNDDTETKTGRCQWRISTPVPRSVIDFTVLFIDLPSCPNTALTIASTTLTGSHYPRIESYVLTLTNTSVTSTSPISIRASNLLVTYHHPSGSDCDVTGSRGFYLRYEIRQQGRVRRDAQSVSSTSLPGETETKETKPPSDPESDSDTWKIVVGVVIPIVIIAIIAVVVYKVYRKKFPVRMIFGREFGIFRNPSYNRPRGDITLVRDEDNWRSSGVSADYNPDYQTSDYKIPCDNRGFQGDDDEFEEDKADREFRMRKSWLFKKEAGDAEVDNDGSSKAGTEDSHETNVKKIISVPSDIMRVDSKEFSDDSDIEAMLQDQKLTPKPKRRVISGSDLSTSSTSSSEYTVEERDEMGGNSKSSAQERKVDIKISEHENKPSVDEEADLIAGCGLLYQQPTVDQVRAEMKARAQSLTVESPRPRSSSIQIDPTKSARRKSDNDVGNGGDTKEIDLRKYVHNKEMIKNNPNVTITASVVSVEFLSASVRKICSSLSSVVSNPHLVTDLDDDSDFSDDYDNEIDNYNNQTIEESNKNVENRNKEEEAEDSRSLGHITFEVNNRIEERECDGSGDVISQEKGVNFQHDNILNTESNEFGDGDQHELMNDDISVRIKENPTDTDVNSEDIKRTRSGSGRSSPLHSMNSHGVPVHHEEIVKDQNGVEVVKHNLVSKNTREDEDENNELPRSPIVSEYDDDVINPEPLVESNRHKDGDNEYSSRLQCIAEDHQSKSNTVQDKYISCKDSRSYSESNDTSPSSDDENEIEHTTIIDATKSKEDIVKDYNNILPIEEVSVSTDVIKETAAVNEDEIKIRLTYRDGGDNQKHEEIIVAAEIGVGGSVDAKIVTNEDDDSIVKRKTKIGIVSVSDDSDSSSLGSSTGSGASHSHEIGEEDTHSNSDSDQTSSDDSSNNQASYSFGLDNPEKNNTLDEEREEVSVRNTKGRKRLTSDFETAQSSSSSTSHNFSSMEKCVRLIDEIKFSDTSSISSISSDDMQDNNNTILAATRTTTTTATTRTRTRNENKEIGGSRQPMKKISLAMDWNSDQDDDSVDSSNSRNERERNDIAPNDMERFNSMTVMGSDRKDSLLQRDRSSTSGGDALDVYDEFSDDNLDGMLTLNDGRDEEEEEEEGSADRGFRTTIGVDPDLKFTFNDSPKTRIKFRDESDEDEMDV